MYMTSNAIVQNPLVLGIKSVRINMLHDHKNKLKNVASPQVPGPGFIVYMVDEL